MPVPLRILAELSAEDLKELDRRLSDRRESYKQLTAWLRDRGYSVTRTNVHSYATSQGLRPRKRSTFLKLDHTLSDEHRVEYERLIADPRTTAEAARQWLLERGYGACLGTVKRHRRQFMETIKSVRESAKVASEIVHITRAAGTSQLSEGVVAKLEQVILQQLVLLKEKEHIAPKDLTELSKCISQAVNTRETVESIRRDFDEEKRKAAKAAEEVAKAGASGKDVVVRMREILGV